MRVLIESDRRWSRHTTSRRIPRQCGVWCLFCNRRLRTEGYQIDEPIHSVDKVTIPDDVEERLIGSEVLDLCIWPKNVQTKSTDRLLEGWQTFSGPLSGRNWQNSVIGVYQVGECLSADVYSGFGSHVFDNLVYCHAEYILVW